MKYASRCGRDRGRGFWRVGVVVLVFAASVSAGLSTAAAAGHRAAHPAVPAVGPSVLRPADEPGVHRGSFWTQAACTQAGRKGVTAERWSRFTCVSSAISWSLWTDR